ncbi:hypothetical protein CLROS_021030 [Clostridium felsineum]|uniref:Uncharacterized protein n=2 Tax=Clostridium felsineum TaxID=36839 RepID=A0A1S8M2I9_9CLOT|nr:hypothetical protein CLROS_021030 [Clostridium felsineum]URZ11802.1 hypothetical protein CROST_025190 [Clostridium felsineum]
MSMELEGFDSLMQKLESMGKVGNKIYNEALTKSAEPILDDIQSTNAFKDKSGKLRKSFKISKVKKNKEGKFVWVGDVDGVVKYSWYVEHKHPYMRPAFEKRKKEIFENIKKYVQEGLDNG